MKRIKIPCVKCRPINEQEYIIVTGFNHSDCYDYLYAVYEIPARVCPERYECIEGYLCTDDTFVDRSEAMEIAKAARQVKDLYNNDNYIALQSYMLKEDHLV